MGADQRGRFGGGLLAKAGDRGGVVGGAEHRGAGDEHVGAGARRARRSCPARCRRRPRARRSARPRVDPAPELPRSCASTPGMNFWPPKPGLTLITSTWSTSPSTGSTADAGVAGFSTTHALRAGLADLREGAVQVRAGLDVHADAVGARARRRPRASAPAPRSSGARRAGSRRRRAERLDHDGPDRQVRDEVAVHHVDVDPVGAGALDRARPPRRAGRSRRRGSTARCGRAARSCARARAARRRSRRCRGGGGRCAGSRRRRGAAAGTRAALSRGATRNSGVSARKARTTASFSSGASVQVL